MQIFKLKLIPSIQLRELRFDKGLDERSNLLWCLIRNKSVEL